MDFDFEYKQCTLGGWPDRLPEDRGRNVAAGSYGVLGWFDQFRVCFNFSDVRANSTKNYIRANFGELTSKIVLGTLLAVMSWQNVFYISVSIAAVLSLPTIVFVKDASSSRQVHPEDGLSSPLQAPSGNVSEMFIKEKEPMNEREKVAIESKNKIASPKPIGKLKEYYQRVFRPLVVNPRFCLILIMAFCTTAIRETLNTWLPKFFKEFHFMSSRTDGGDSLSVVCSAAYNLAAMISSLVGGILLDKVPAKKRGFVVRIFNAIVGALMNDLLRASVVTLLW